MGRNGSSADLRFVLPLRPGDKVVVPADQVELASALSADGISVVPAQDPPWSAETGMADHVLLPCPPADKVEALLGEAARVLRPGASLLLGVGNRYSLQRWARRQDRAAAGVPVVTPQQAQSWLQRYGFALGEAYGVREGLCAPDLIVPLVEPGPTLFYFRERYVPHTRAGVLFRGLATWLAQRERQTVLFHDLLLVSKRSF